MERPAEDRIILTPKEIADVLWYSFMFSQGYSYGQVAFLELLSTYVIVNHDLKDDTLKIFITKVSGLDSTKIERGLVNKTMSEIHPVKLIDVGIHRDTKPPKAHPQGFPTLQPETVEGLNGYFRLLESPNEGKSINQDTRANFLKSFSNELIDRDNHYLEIGRPGTSKNEDEANKDDAKKDKFFSYFVYYILRGGDKYISKNRVGQVLKRIFLDLRNMKLDRNSKDWDDILKLIELYNEKHPNSKVTDEELDKFFRG